MYQDTHVAIFHPDGRAAPDRLVCLDADEAPALTWLTSMAARLFRAPALIFLDEAGPPMLNRVVDSLRLPMVPGAGHMVELFCRHVAATGAPLIVGDARGQAPPGALAAYAADVGAYAGVPLVTCAGAVLGAFCVVDAAPRAWTEDNIAIMRDLALAVITQIDLHRAIVEETRATEALRAGEERYRAFVEHSSEGIWRMELERSLPIDWPEEAQIQHIYQYGYLAECNDVMAQMYGFSRAEDITGGRLSDLLVPSEPQNVEMLRSFIRSGYRLADVESREFDQQGHPRYFLNNFVGIVERGRLVRSWGTQRDNTERRQVIAALRESEERYALVALYNSLTGLPNRALLMERLDRAITLVRQHEKRGVGLLFLDLDRFKNVNDSLGHLIGDELLIATARRLQACLRGNDMVARLGGDEFVILFDNISDAGDATRVAQRIQQEMTVPFRLSGHDVFSSASIGIALSADGCSRPEDLLRDADTAMYRAKALGRARHEVFDTAMHTRAVALLQLENDLRRAIERQEFQLYYQPIVTGASGQVIGVEALVRWQHPQRGLVPPAEFITVAEETGLIVPIGEWVLRTAGAQAKAWHDAGLPPFWVAVNLSARQFKNRELSTMIARTLEETGLAPQYLKLELTESSIMEDAEEAIAALRELKALGVQISIDDFGTGYSSLSYLKAFPLDTLKIARPFVRDITTDPHDAAIATAMIAIAHGLNLNVIAEGVETEEQLAFLLSCKCDAIQGYLFSRPLPAAKLTELLREHRCLPHHDNAG